MQGPGEVCEGLRLGGLAVCVPFKGRRVLQVGLLDYCLEFVTTSVTTNFERIDIYSVDGHGHIHLY